MLLPAGPHNFRAPLIPERRQTSQLSSIKTAEMTSVPLLHCGPCSRSGSRTLILIMALTELPKVEKCLGIRY